MTSVSAAGPCQSISHSGTPLAGLSTEVLIAKAVVLQQTGAELQVARS